MSLGPGARLGPYEITAQIGVGGMGEVYEATDTNLKRAVAIKVLPGAVASDAERLARFQREAEVLASLNHPNIASIYGLERSDGATALVMELVKGETLADRIARGPIPLSEALPIARQIAEALEAAHEQGIIHRDLKPANIKVRSDGTVKVLDFGLAKASEPTSGLSSSLSLSPTITSPAMTQMGVILGTAAYMSPEQAKGRAADKRSDVWAFGCVLFEMLAGRPAFDGEDVTDVIASVVRAEPSWSALPPDVPPLVRALLQRCLEKDRKRRVADISAVIFAISEHAVTSLSVAPVSISAVATRPVLRQALPFLVTALVAALAAGALTAASVWFFGLRAPMPTVSRFTVSLPAGEQFAAPAFSVVAISPDGTQIVYAANQRLFLRSMSLLTPRLIAGTERTSGFAGGPFFSPDGRFVAFWEGTTPSTFTLKKIDVNGGVAVPICQTPTSFGGSWGSDDTIVFGQQKGIMRVSANGGQPELIVEAKRGETVLGPQVLPGGRSILFTLARDIVSPTAASSVERWDKALIVVQSLTSGARKTVVDGGSDARYVESGHLVYAVGDALFAVPFDLNREEVTGPSVPVLDGVRRGAFAQVESGVAQFSVSKTGSLVYAPAQVGAETTQRDLVIINRKGDAESLRLPRRGYESPRVSPKGNELAFATSDTTEANVWIYELAGTRSPRQLTFEGRNRYPIWTADGQRVAFQSDRDGDLGVFWQRADGTTAAERLTKAETGAAHVPRAWSPDGRTLLVAVTQDFNFAKSLFAFSVADRKVTPVVEATQSTDPADATFSSDGRWIAYSSDAQIFVQPFPAMSAKYSIPTRAVHPIWSRDGNELYFEALGPRGLLNVLNVTTQPIFAFGNPVTVPTGPVQLGFTSLERQYDVMPNGRGLVAALNVRQSESEAPLVTQIQVVLNWAEELKRLAPTK